MGPLPPDGVKIIWCLNLVCFIEDRKLFFYKAARSEKPFFIPADGEAARQDIFHLHLHIIPCYRTDNFSMSSQSRSIASREELGSLADQIKDAL